MPPSVIYFDLLLVQTAGAIQDIGEIRLVARAAAFVVSDSPIRRAHVSVLAPAGTADGWREYRRDLTDTEAREIAESLDTLGLARHAAHLTSQFDTSDYWSHLTLRVSDDKNSATTTVSTLSSGFEGPIAEGLRALLRSVLEMAGYTEYDRVLYGDNGD